MVDGSDNEMVDDAANAKPGDVFMQGVSHVVDDVTELTMTGLKRASFDPGDVVVALSAGEKGDGFVPSSTIEEGRVVYRRTLVALNLGQTDCRCVVVHPADPEFDGPNIAFFQAEIELSCLALELAWLLAC
ncbi:hypothetical protein Tco_1186824 [Tanacetum coccineum]